MKKIMVAASLVILLGGAAIAQTGGSKGSTSGGASSGTAWPAPVGHRQPRAADVPSEKNLSNPNTPANKEDAELDRKIKSICRGC
ncbi:hypothetical protein LPJ38_23865 [Bradyrhizobium daqingense]|uniref:Uncharacterized protein n=1 Tax=Bradyrhizobium daqingense TaxID=993502 RepID=A0A562LBL8_9BRAD|nr:hypothetical protein [Bradyrhizobium daqingense]TWI05072.1 hypothetical protein IQ17_03235 [Bradyrhizobium daqingense]UFS86698.1 hypothetical protein LPJ38_23865 [Bradyrhizobium daqingense]